MDKWIDGLMGVKLALGESKQVIIPPTIDQSSIFNLQFSIFNLAQGNFPAS